MFAATMVLEDHVIQVQGMTGTEITAIIGNSQTGQNVTVTVPLNQFSCALALAFSDGGEEPWMGGCYVEAEKLMKHLAIMVRHQHIMRAPWDAADADSPENLEMFARVLRFIP